MRVLSVGEHLWGDRAHLDLYRSARGHEVRTLAVSGDADFFFSPEETAETVIRRVAREWEPDLLFCAFPELRPPPCRVEDCPIKTATVVSDWNLYQPQLEHNLARFDIVLCDRLGEQRLHVCGATPRYVEPVFTHRSLLHRNLGLARDIDVLFLGNLNHAVHTERGRILEATAALSDECRVVVDGEFPPDEYVRLLNRSRIALNYAVHGGMNLRCYEAPACGALLFLEEENIEGPDFLAPGDAAVYYRADNLAALIRYYLGHEAERARIAAAGEARVAELAIERKLDRLLDWLEAQPRGARAFHTFDGLTRALADVLLYASSRDSGQQALAAEYCRDFARQYPGTAANLALGCLVFAEAVHGTQEARVAGVREAVRLFHTASVAAPRDVAPWLNLATVARATRAANESHFLEMALRADCADFGGLVLGHIHDPYYGNWRRTLGLGEATPEHFRAAAAARLAEVELAKGNLDRALELADTAIQWCPRIGRPYGTAAQACAAKGEHSRAVAYLVRGLPYAAFDPGYRMQLLEAQDAAGLEEDARSTALESARIFQTCPRFAEQAAAFRSRAERQSARS